MVETNTQQSEEQLAIERNQITQNDLIRKRNWSLAFSIFSVILGGIVLINGFAMTALLAFIVGLIYLSQYFDANGHLHEVQCRSTKRLVRDFSVLHRSESGNTGKTQSSSNR